MGFRIGGVAGIGIAAGLTLGVGKGIWDTAAGSTDLMMESILGDKQADRLVTGRDLQFNTFYSLPHPLPHFDIPFAKGVAGVRAFRQAVDVNPLAPITGRPIMEARNPIMIDNYNALKKNKIGRSIERQASYEVKNGITHRTQMPFASGDMVFGMNNLR